MGLFTILSDDPMLKKALLDPDLEANYPILIDDVIHTLCFRSMTCSELLSMLPDQPTSSLLFDDCSQDEENPSESVPSGSSYNSSRPTAVPPTSFRSKKRAVEEILPKLLDGLTTRSSVSGCTVFHPASRSDGISFQSFLLGLSSPGAKFSK